MIFYTILSTIIILYNTFIYIYIFGSLFNIVQIKKSSIYNVHTKILLKMQLTVFKAVGKFHFGAGEIPGNLRYSVHLNGRL